MAARMDQPPRGSPAEADSDEDMDWAADEVEHDEELLEEAEEDEPGDEDDESAIDEEAAQAGFVSAMDEAVFQSRDELMRAVQEFALEHGFAVSIQRSKEGLVHLQCTRGGHERNTHKLTDDSRRRTTASRRQGCPFRCRGSRQRDGTWVLVMLNDEHTHPPSTDPRVHPQHRQLTPALMDEIRRLTRANVMPQDILATLMEADPSVNLVVKDIHNARQRIRAQDLAGRTATQALLDSLNGREDVFVRHDTDAVEGHITRLFFATRTAIEMARYWRYVIVADCTYKTNVYRMPLLDFVGISGSNASFFVANAFLDGEREEDYAWALQQLHTALGFFPAIFVVDRDLAFMGAIARVTPSRIFLCRWHINKKVLAHFNLYSTGPISAERRDAFMAQWHGVVSAATPQQFDERWAALQHSVAHIAYLAAYIADTWLVHKELFVSAWVDRYTHFNTVATSRAEGAHWIIKRNIGTSGADLQRAADRILRYLVVQQQEVLLRLLGQQQQRPLHSAEVSAVLHRVRTWCAMHAPTRSHCARGTRSSSTPSATMPLGSLRRES